MRRLLSALAVALSVGCGGPPPVVWYTPPQPARADSSARAETLAVRPFVVDPACDGVRVIYRTGPATLHRYSDREWAADPGLLFAGWIAERLRPAFREVRGPESPPAADLLLTGRIRRLEVEAVGSETVARVTIDLQLAPAPWNGPLEVEAHGADFETAVEALGPALAAAVDALPPTWPAAPDSP